VDKGFFRALVVSVLMVCAGALLSAQETAQPGGDNLDNLFNDNGTNGSSTATAGTNGSDQAAPPQAPQAPATRPDDLTHDNKMHYFASLNIYGLFGLGWSQVDTSGFPQFVQSLGSPVGVEGSGSLTASLGVDLRPAPELRLRGTMSYSFPGAGSQLSELIVDYSVRESVFFRLGIFDYTWGNSQFFQFGNLPARGLPDWGLNNQPLWQKTNIINNVVQTNYPASVRIYVPFGVNGLTLLSRFDLQNYGFPGTPPTPDPRDAGYGLQLDLVTGPIQWTLSGFYQRLLTPRSSLALKTSILGFDLSVEGTMAFPFELNDNGLVSVGTAGGGIYVGGLLQRIYPTAVIGVAREWVDARFKMYAEYAFNGERDVNTPAPGWLLDAPGPGGHNSAVALRFANLGESAISLNVLWQQNWSDGSGLICSFFEVSPVALTTIQLGPVFLYGTDNSEVQNNRLVPGGKKLELLLLVKISDSYRQ
jgi:hypothetical protein